MRPRSHPRPNPPPPIVNIHSLSSFAVLSPSSGLRPLVAALDLDPAHNPDLEEIMCSHVGESNSGDDKYGESEEDNNRKNERKCKNEKGT
jgi:hypothetical protein